MADTDIIASLLQTNEELQAQLHDENEITNVLSKRVEILEQDNHIFARIITTHIKQVQYILSQPNDNTEKLKDISLLIEELIPREEIQNEVEVQREVKVQNEVEVQREVKVQPEVEVQPEIKMKKPRKKKDN